MLFVEGYYLVLQYLDCRLWQMTGVNFLFWNGAYCQSVDGLAGWLAGHCYYCW